MYTYASVQIYIFAVLRVVIGMRGNHIPVQRCRTTTTLRHDVDADDGRGKHEKVSGRRGRYGCRRCEVGFPVPNDMFCTKSEFVCRYENYVKHAVQSDDTLVGIALRYGVNVGGQL